MTLITGAVGVALSIALAVLLGDLGAAASLRGRAQAAADAAALAAVAESGPYGNGRPEHEAQLYARRNGATLIECRCDVGASAVQVTVEIDHVIARARAVIDPAAIAPALLASPGRLHPRLAQAVDALVRASNGRVYVVSGARSTVEQARLWQDALSKYGSAEAADDWVAPPGSSMHERGLAVDLGGDLGLAAALIDRLGLPLWRPMNHEPWHFELIGSRT